MTHPINQALADQLSAYLDGALSPEDAADIERLVETDPQIAAEFSALSRVDQATRNAFDAMLADPVPMSLARSIGDTPLAQMPAANLPSRPIWRSIAAALALVLIGGAGGAYLTRSIEGQQVTSAMPWLDQVAGYHLIYAAQSRHLVEVPASDKDHLQTWLSSTTGVHFTVPDLSATGLTFQGGRLLVASGKPVAQLLYTDAKGQVVAVCFLSGGDAAAGEGTTALTPRDTNGVHMVWWNSKDASYVVVGPSTGIDLQPIAKAVSVAL